MATITKIVVTRGRTLNMGNYQSERVELSMEATIHQGDDWTGVQGDLLNNVEDSLGVICEEIKPGSGR